jgi:hypothetical protein
MANLHISEFSGLGQTEQSDSVPCVSADAHVTDQVVAIGAGSVQSAAFQSGNPQTTNPISQGTAPNTSPTKWVLLTAGANCAVAFGANPTATAGSIFLPMNVPMLVRVPAGQNWMVAVIQVTSE